MVGIESGWRARSPADPLCLQPFPIHSWGAAGGAHLAAAVPLTALPLGQPPCLAPPPPLPGTQVMVRDSSAPPGWPAAHQIGVNQYQEHLLIGRCGDVPRHSPAGTGVWKASQAPCTDHSLWQ